MKEMDVLLARKLFVAMGVLTEVAEQEKGDVVAILTAEEMAAYEELAVQAAEIRSLEKLLKELKIKINTKVLVHNARRDMWWNCMEDTHGVSREQSTAGLHVDRTSSSLRKGILADNTYGLNRT